MFVSIKWLTSGVNVTLLFIYIFSVIKVFFSHQSFKVSAPHFCVTFCLFHKIDLFIDQILGFTVSICSYC